MEDDCALLDGGWVAVVASLSTGDAVVLMVRWGPLLLTLYCTDALRIVDGEKTLSVGLRCVALDRKSQ